ncbi:MAG: TlpA family protein disulfide reductase [Deltaproteobacteria bacterium]|nr:TlpA family protein disulfide reductase [Deltaproteobacteria bacterium]TLN03405.1 MAG: TlpA family protein disulfide reductase [bacterium]
MDYSRMKKVLSLAFFITVLTLPALSHALPQKGSPAPAIKVVTTSGQKVTLANYRGYVLVMEFFATWCDGCRDSLPHLIRLNKTYGKQGLQILGLNPGVGGDDLPRVRKFIREERINFPVALVDDDILINYSVQPIPAIFIIDKKGVLVEKYVGFSPAIEASMEKTIKTLLAQ